MMKKSIMPFLVLLLVLAGCNDDVFIDGPQMPDEISATIEGNGGEAEFTLQTKGLQRISLDVTSSGMKNCTFYDRNGAKADSDIPASELGKIVFASRNSWVEIIKDGKRLIFRSIEQPMNMVDHWSVRLDYDYTVKFIEIAVTPGKPRELVGVEYTTDMKVTDAAEVKTRRWGMTNNGSVTQKLEVWPYLQEEASVTVTPRQTWANGDTVMMSVPWYEDGSWMMKPRRVRLDVRAIYYRPDQKKIVDVDVPPYSKVVVFTDVTYSRAEANGKIIFRNPVSDRRDTLDFTCVSLYPVSYENRIETSK